MNSVFKITPLDNSTLQEYKDAAIEGLNQWFNRNWIYNTPKIFVVDDRKTIDMLKGKKSENWVVGWSDGSRAIYILNPDNISKESSHNGDTYNVAKLIKHELCHSFFRKTFGESMFAWINEGVSIYVADQLDKYPMPSEFNGFLEGKKVYQESGNAIKLLVDRFGKDKLFDFLKKQSETKDREDLNHLFKEEYGDSLDYSFFNSLKHQSKLH